MATKSQQSALKQGYITKKQYDKLPAKMLDGIIRHNKKAHKKPGKAPSKAAKKAPKKKAHKKR